MQIFKLLPASIASLALVFSPMLIQNASAQGTTSAPTPSPAPAGAPVAVSQGTGGLSGLALVGAGVIIAATIAVAASSSGDSGTTGTTGTTGSR